MRADLPSAVASAIERCDRPSLIFDLATIEANLAAIARAARNAGVTALFAAKSFPHPEVRAIAARELDGFDAASTAEVIELPAAGTLSIADPTGRASAAAERWPHRLIVSCDTVEQVHAAPARAAIAIRLSASLTGRDPAIGAVLDGSGHRRSRFGLDVASERRSQLIAAMARAAGDRPIGLHIHHGPVAATSSERFSATARAAIAAASAAGVSPRFLNLGGAWHAIADLRTTLAEVRSAIARDIEVLIEPGRLASEAAGFACGHVVVARELDDRPLRVVDVSRICHLRWSHIELVASAPHAGTGQRGLFVGPTCFEDDVLGDWTIAPDAFPPGARVVVRNVCGYAVAWNTGFGGVAPADVVVVS
ncbi:MAG: hypothetical protein AB7O24_24885 [Kofleriaceae bacterium]